MDLPKHFKQALPEHFYAQAKVEHHKIEDATIALRVFGQGPALVLIHGYPVHGYTWRKLLPRLARDFRCYVIDLPGLGDSDWTSDTNFSFSAQARRLALLFESLDLKSYSIIAHDTGATLARLLALLQPNHVSKLAIINTEIPNHRPPWIPFYQFCAKLPFSRLVFQSLLKSHYFLRSPMGLGQFYSNPRLFEDPSNIAPYITPLTASAKRAQGMLGYLVGIEWAVVDELQHRHKDIRADVQFLWGENDKTFPVELAEKMCSQFSKKPQFVRIEYASLMPQEEQPDQVLEHLIPFLSAR